MLDEYNLRKTKKNPGICLIYVGMKIRFTTFTTSVHPPFVVQDCTGTVVGLEVAKESAKHACESQSDVVLHALPKAIYIKLDDCNEIFLPPKQDVDMKGLFALKPLQRDWVFHSPTVQGFSTQVRRTGFPLAPFTTCPIYSMQGTTAEGLLMHWKLPARLSSEVRWLIVYVALSRVRCLSKLKSLGLTDAIRGLIEWGPPPSLLQGFALYFGDKLEKTIEKAQTYREALGWPLDL